MNAGHQDRAVGNLAGNFHYPWAGGRYVDRGGHATAMLHPAGGFAEIKLASGHEFFHHDDCIPHLAHGGRGDADDVGRAIAPPDPDMGPSRRHLRQGLGR